MEKGRQSAWQPESTLLRLGIAAARAGHEADARQYFRQILRTNPQHQLAWMWMGGVVETDAERAHCLRQLLLIDPTHGTARRGLAKLEARMAAEPTEFEPSAPPEDHRPEGGDSEGGDHEDGGRSGETTCP